MSKCLDVFGFGPAPAPILLSGGTTTGNQPDGAVVHQVFLLFEDYLENKLEIERKSMINKEVVPFKFKGD